MPARRTTPHAPRGCWLAAAERDNDAAGSAAARLVLDDLADALAAYERISAVRTNTPVAHIPCTHLAIRGASLCKGAHPLIAPDALVIAGAIAADSTSHDLLARTLQRLAKMAPPTSEACAWGIALGPGDDLSACRDELLSLQTACAAVGIRWCGGILTPDGTMLPALMRSPRLGAFRRPLSESIDRLIAALRLGRSIAELDRILDAPNTRQHRGSVPAARPADIIEVPRTLSWKLFARLH